ncbi:MAG: hypothetical protein ABTQ31_15595 [Rhizobiaceae bacterium]
MQPMRDADACDLAIPAKAVTITNDSCDFGSGELNLMKSILSRLAISVLAGGLVTWGAVAGETGAASTLVTPTELGYAVSDAKGMRLSRFIEAPMAAGSEEAGVPDAFIPTPPGVSGHAEAVITGASGSGALADMRSVGMPMPGNGATTLDPVIRVLPDSRPIGGDAAAGAPAAGIAATASAGAAQPAKRKPLRVAGAESPAPVLKRPMPIVIGAFR